MMKAEWSAEVHDNQSTDASMKQRETRNGKDRRLYLEAKLA
jgi:hypothetical protein